jgi:hypothetical protein
MYYPFLRARQFELITLRELAIEGITQNFVFPILEPVKESHNNLSLAVKVLDERNQGFFFIVNPLVGEVPGDNTYYLKLINQYNSKNIKVAFHYRENSEYIRQSIADFHLNNCLIICPTDTTIEDQNFCSLVSSDYVSAICAESPGRNRAMHRFLRGLGKTYIRLDDFFEKQLNNSAFLYIAEHRFSEEHLYYQEEGFTGFSDYTVLPSEYIDGGSTPRAVVIHLTYLKNEGQIWIRHFTSNTNDSIANVQGKFAEASQKAVSFCRENEFLNSAIEELFHYYDSQHYPGLGIVKKISIKNHLIIVSDYLRNL